MKNPLVKILLINLILFILLFVIFYISAFLLGYASNGGFQLERKLFVKFAIAHFAINFFILHKSDQLNWQSAVASIFLLVFLYLMVSWKAGYL